ncbi:hypothetical protein [Pseudoalteromonas sp. SR45-4]|uniref:hypothetical protein n=1 Tax=Pseudoalteromonas sp. SR45-4 TaxID=2760929 RepID=UPI0015FC1975|nr:hypothetical protein [Pseudoalteromonas sp. SR45-4]MBB1371263.1 hypothetical protein [Pseudoalteromonas sp. SR45-4]
MQYSLVDSAAVIGLNSARLKVVNASPLPTDLFKLIKKSGFCKPAKCFDNSWAIVNSDLLLNAQYVLALGVKVLPVEHALIYFNGAYYDPTWEINLGSVGVEYLVIEQWAKSDLIEAANASRNQNGNIYPPMIVNLKQSLQFKYLFDV